MNVLSSTFYHLLSDNLMWQSDALAVIDSDKMFTYKKLSHKVDLIAHHLLLSGVQPGDRVIVHLRKSFNEIAAMFAVAKVGAVVINVNIQWTVEQLIYVKDDCQANVLITNAGIAKKLSIKNYLDIFSEVLVEGSLPESYQVTELSNLDQCDSLNEVPVLSSSLAMIIYTSGSTGRPKGVMLSHQNILAGARSVARYLKLTNKDRLLSVLPYSFDAGLNQLTTMMLMGGVIVNQPVIMATEIVKSIKLHSVTGFAAVPPIWNQVVQLLLEHPVKMSSLKRITNTGGKIPLNILKSMPSVFPEVEIFLMYGLTEAFRSTYLDPSKFIKKMGSIGQAVPDSEIYVIKKGIGLAGPGEIGELIHRGPLVSLGYWDNPKATAEKIKPCPELNYLIGNDLVVYSGDLVKLDSDGDLWFISRNDSMIKTSGFRVSPDEVEDLISQSGMVGDVIAYSVEDDQIGEVINVVFTPLKKFNQKDMLKHCQKMMPHYMIPKKFDIWEGNMPQTASGKLDRSKIIEGLVSNMRKKQS